MWSHSRCVSVGTPDLTSGCVYVAASGFTPGCYYVGTPGLTSGCVYVVKSGFDPSCVYVITSGNTTEFHVVASGLMQ